MSRPTERVLAVLELLQSRGRVSGPELAQRIGVDGRTLRRYIAMFRRAIARADSRPLLFRAILDHVGAREPDRHHGAREDALAPRR